MDSSSYFIMLVKILAIIIIVSTLTLSAPSRFFGEKERGILRNVMPTLVFILERKV